MTIRPVEVADRERIQEILISTARFTEDEIVCAVELVDLTIAKGAKSDYEVIVVEETDGEETQVQGYVCYGATPLTDGVFDLYWIAVDPLRQGHGLGQLLLRFVETEVRKANGRMLLIETSSKESYQPTVRFYNQSGYEEISRIKDFYRVEDDKVIFCKKLRA
ncbi:MAG TPA: GNAT family N-acetyltransferase [Thermoanaerobaculia bacterium]|nr:GNAT family N-acetyltransferase [Thermoanaerobaculia bacterium]